MKAVPIKSEKALIYIVSTTLKTNQYVLIRQRKSGYTLNMWRIPKTYYMHRLFKRGKKAWLNIKREFAEKHLRRKSGFAFAIWRIKDYCESLGLSCSPVFVVKHNDKLAYFYLVITTADSYKLLQNWRNHASA